MAALLAAGAFGTAGGLLRSRYERDHFVVEETEIVSPKIKREWKLVFLTDMHDKEFGDGNRRFLDALAKLSPDAVLIGGDMMIAKPGKARLAATRRLLDGVCHLEGHPPVFYADGNHEQRMRREREQYGTVYQEFVRLLKEYQVSYLADCTGMLGEDIAVSGLQIEQNYYKNFIPEQMEEDYIKQHLGAADSERFQILLAHSPLFLEAYAAWGADLTLAGHFHGGTIRIPGLGGVMTPQFQFFLPYCAGTFERDGRRMIVGRGLGTHSINLRVGNKPQVVVVRLKPQTIF
ncbi:MAG: metallophosphoesterase [Lachnospiraceae bacterium]|nr:metallophosphoesterase [Lachnospiraceae bacterium]